MSITTTTRPASELDTKPSPRLDRSAATPGSPTKPLTSVLAEIGRDARADSQRYVDGVDVPHGGE